MMTEDEVRNLRDRSKEGLKEAQAANNFELMIKYTAELSILKKVLEAWNVSSPPIFFSVIELLQAKENSLQLSKLHTPD